MKKAVISVFIVVGVLVVFLLFNDNMEVRESCFNCGEKIAKDSSYCEHCGENLKNIDEEIVESTKEVVENSTEETIVQNTTTETTTKKQETTTKKKTESSKPMTTKKAENKITTTTEISQVVPNMDDVEKKYFQQLFAVERERYVLNVSRDINSLESEKSQLKSEASKIYTQYQKDKEIIKEEYASMGMLNSGAYKARIERLDNEYKSASSAYTKRINELENQIALLEEEKQNPSVENVLKQLAYNHDMSYGEAVNRYNKYIAS